MQITNEEAHPQNGSECYWRIALTWVPEGRRRKGHPRETWIRTVQKDLKETGLKT